MLKEPCGRDTLRGKGETDMKFRMAGIAQDSIVDGPGIRLTVFFQGCPHGCPGCHNPQTHDFAGGREGDTEEILTLLKSSSLTTGLTLSGGEPFCQPEAFRILAEGARAAKKDVWAYSGYTYEKLLADPDKAPLLALCDVLVDGPFLLAKRSLALDFCGSSNQRLIDLTKTRESGKIVFWKDPWSVLE